MSSFPSEQETFSEYGFGGTTLLALPSSLDSQLLGLACFLPHTWRRYVFKQALRIILGSRVPIASRFPRSQNPLWSFTGTSVGHVESVVSAAVGASCTTLAIAWPKQKSRGRAYVHLSADTGQRYFAKVDSDSAGTRRSENEARTLGRMEGSSPLGVKTPRLAAWIPGSPVSILVTHSLPPDARFSLRGVPTRLRRRIGQTSHEGTFVQGADVDALPWLREWSASTESNKALSDTVIHVLRTGIHVGFAHGDVAPANVFVSKKRYWLVDWEESSYQAPAWTDVLGSQIIASGSEATPGAFNRLVHTVRRQITLPNVLAAVTYLSQNGHIEADRLLESWRNDDSA